MDNFDIYISSKGYLVIPKYGIEFLINFNESNIPSMPEAVEASARIAGRDGDIVLNTTYEPISFDIVCYTEDNLTVEEKVEKEQKVNKFLNSIKKNTATFAMQNENKFYNVKYNGAITIIRYPKHLQFTIPLKSSDSYAKALTESQIIGEGSKESETIEDAGAVFIINGPAQTPIISLNDYLMEYKEVLLEGQQLVIDSRRSTVTHINSEGVLTNVMKYYNHQFPKIKNGTNELKVLSGIDDASQVSVQWYDLKL